MWLAFWAQSLALPVVLPGRGATKLPGARLSLCRMEVTPLRPKFNFNLEALRGVAALTVAWHHAIYHQRHLDPSYAPTGA